MMYCNGNNIPDRIFHNINEHDNDNLLEKPREKHQILITFHSLYWKELTFIEMSNPQLKVEK